MQKYCALLRDFPVQSLLTATSWTAMGAAVSDVFAHLRHVKRSDYPLSRAVELVHSCARGMCVREMKWLISPLGRLSVVGVLRRHPVYWCLWDPEN